MLEIFGKTWGGGACSQGGITFDARMAAAD